MNVRFSPLLWVTLMLCSILYVSQGDVIPVRTTQQAFDPGQGSGSHLEVSDSTSSSSAQQDRIVWADTDPQRSNPPALLSFATHCSSSTDEDGLHHHSACLHEAAHSQPVPLAQLSTAQPAATIFQPVSPPVQSVHEHPMAHPQASDSTVSPPPQEIAAPTAPLLDPPAPSTAPPPIPMLHSLEIPGSVLPASHNSIPAVMDTAPPPNRDPLFSTSASSAQAELTFADELQNPQTTRDTLPVKDVPADLPAEQSSGALPLEPDPPAASPTPPLASTYTVTERTRRVVTPIPRPDDFERSVPNPSSALPSSPYLSEPSPTKLDPPTNGAANLIQLGINALPSSSNPPSGSSSTDEAGGPAAHGDASHQQHHHQSRYNQHAHEDDDDRKINLASAFDGASILASNKEARRPDRTIDDDGESFMKNPCAASKWLIIELSQLGRVDAVELNMKEMYSSRVKGFSVKGRQSMSKKEGPDHSRGLESDTWTLLASFTAENKKGSQRFVMPTPRHRVRYLLLQFLTHYGSEEVCALNNIRVLGVTAARELELALSRSFETEDEEVVYNTIAQPAPPAQPLPQAPVTVTTTILDALFNPKESAAAGVEVLGRSPLSRNEGMPDAPIQPPQLAPPSAGSDPITDSAWEGDVIPWPPLTPPPQQSPPPPSAWDPTSAQQLQDPRDDQADSTQGASTEDAGSAAALSAESLSALRPTCSDPSDSTCAPGDAAAITSPTTSQTEVGSPVSEVHDTYPPTATPSKVQSTTGSAATEPSGAGALLDVDQPAPSLIAGTNGQVVSAHLQHTAGLSDVTAQEHVDVDLPPHADAALSSQTHHHSLPLSRGNITFASVSAAAAADVVAVALAIDSRRMGFSDQETDSAGKFYTAPHSPIPSTADHPRDPTTHTRTSSDPNSPDTSAQPQATAEVIISADLADVIELSPFHSSQRSPPLSNQPRPPLSNPPRPPPTLEQPSSPEYPQIQGLSTQYPKARRPHSGTAPAASQPPDSLYTAPTIKLLHRSPASTAPSHLQVDVDFTHASPEAMQILGDSAATSPLSVDQSESDSPSTSITPPAQSTTSDLINSSVPTTVYPDWYNISAAAATAGSDPAPITAPSIAVPPEPSQQPPSKPATAHGVPGSSSRSSHEAVAAVAAAVEAVDPQHLAISDGFSGTGVAAVPASVINPQIALSGTGVNIITSAVGGGGGGDLPSVLPVLSASLYGFSGMELLLEGSSSSKPKQAGNLFDVVKQEMMSLKLNQTKVWKYIKELVDALNKRAEELEEENDRLETRVDALAMAAASAPTKAEIDAWMGEALRQHQASITALIATHTAERQAATAAARVQRTTMLLLGSAVLGMVLWVWSGSAGDGRGSGRVSGSSRVSGTGASDELVTGVSEDVSVGKGGSVFRRLIIMLCVANGLVAVLLHCDLQWLDCRGLEGCVWCVIEQLGRVWVGRRGMLFRSLGDTTTWLRG